MSKHDFPIEQSVIQPHHLRVRSGNTVVGYVPGTISGVKAVLAPPYTANDYRLLISFVDETTGLVIRDWEEHNICESVSRLELVGGFPDAADVRSLYQGGDWLGWALKRKGAVRWRQEGKLISFRLQTTLAPLSGTNGFVLSYEFTEIEIPGDELVLKLEHSDFHFGEVRPWVWVDTISKFPAQWPTATEVQGENCAACLGVSAGTFDGTTWRLPLQGKTSLQAQFFFVVGPDLATARKNLAALSDQELIKAQKVWDRAAGEIEHNVPAFQAEDSALVEYFDRSLTSLLINRWDTPAFRLRPHISTSGLGHATSVYVWDASYCPKVLTLWDPAVFRAHLLGWLSIDLHAWNQFSALDGACLGGWYSLNDFSILKMVCDYCAITGDRSLLEETVHGETVLRHLETLLKDSETRFEQSDFLVNYGRNENLLELRSSGYEGFVASPNAERVFCWQTLAKLKEWMGEEAGPARQLAASIQAALFQQLWNEEEGWFDAITPEGCRETVFSVQVYNILCADIFDDAKLDRFLSHLRDDRFLSACGMESFSKHDIRYELNDLDWSGGGTYLGCSPVLVGDLYQAGRPKEAWEILRRLLWWPEVFPYYPQVVRARTRGYEERQRPSCISAGAAAEAVLFGIFGLRYDLNGQVTACVCLPPGSGAMQVDRVPAGGRQWTIKAGPEGVTLSDGSVSSAHPLGERFVLAENRG